MNRFANYYKKIFSQEYIDRTISGGIKSQLTLLLVTIATALAIFFIIAMLFSIQLHGHEEWGERLWAVYNNFVDPGNQIEETAWPTPTATCGRKSLITLRAFHWLRISLINTDTFFHKRLRSNPAIGSPIIR